MESLVKCSTRKNALFVKITQATSVKLHFPPLLTLCPSLFHFSADEQAEVAKMQDRQLERAMSSLRSVRIYKERQAALNAAPKTTADASPVAPKPADGATPAAR